MSDSEVDVEPTPEPEPDHATTAQEPAPEESVAAEAPMPAEREAEPLPPETAVAPEPAVGDDESLPPETPVAPEPATESEPVPPVEYEQTAEAGEPAPSAEFEVAPVEEPAGEPLVPAVTEGAEGLKPPEVVPPIVPHEPVMMQILGGIVTGVTNKEVDLTLDDGRPAVIHRENFDLAGTDPTTVLQVGDGAEGAVLSREDPRSRVVLSRKWVQRDRAWKKAAACVEDHSTMHVKIVSVSKKGVVVDVMGLRGFVPLNHFQLEPNEPSAELVAQMVELRVIAADRQKDKLLLSRRSQLLKEQRKAEAEALQRLKVGSVVKGKVVDLTQFGAFVEIGEEDHRVRGLLHVSEMSWDRISSPKGHVAVGDEIDVKIIDVKVKKKRVSLSRKELIEDPLAAIEVGSIHTGKVKRLVDYGVFVDIGPAEGMVHLSELAEYRPNHPSEIVLRGDEVQVKVLKVSKAKRRIELSMRQALYPS